MNSQLLISVGVLAYVGYRIYGYWQADSFDAVPKWQWALWGALIVLCLLQIVRGLRASRRPRA